MAEQIEDISLLIPEEEVASGQHIPNEQTLWSVPNDAVSEAKDDLKKEALGLTSIPSSTNGGELLDLDGVPENPGLQRDLGDDEETDFFGAPDTNPSEISPKNYKSNPLIQEAINNSLKAEKLGRQFMKDELEKLSNLLKKNNASTEGKLITKLSEIIPSVNYSTETIKREKTAKTVAAELANLNGGAGWASALTAQINEMGIVNGTINLDWIIKWVSVAALWKALVESNFPHRPDYTASNTFFSWVAYGKSLVSGGWSLSDPPERAFTNMLNADFAGGGEIARSIHSIQDMRPTLAYGNLALDIIGKDFAGGYTVKSLEATSPHRVEESIPSERAPMARPEPAQKQYTPTPTIPATEVQSPVASGWENYLSKMGEVGQKIKDAWSVYNPTDATFKAWVAWYKQQLTSEKSYLSPAEVLERLSAVVQPEVSAPTAPATEPPPIAEGTTPEEKQVETEGVLSPNDYIAIMGEIRKGKGQNNTGEIVADLLAEQNPENRHIVLVEWEGEEDPKQRYDSLVQRENGKFYPDYISRSEMKLLRKLYRAPMTSTKHDVRHELRRERRERKPETVKPARLNAIAEILKKAKS